MDKRIKPVRVIAMMLVLACMLFLLCTCTANEKEKSGSGSKMTLADMEGKTIADVTGSVFADMVKEAVPNAEVEFYNTFTDQVNAVKTGKADGLVCNEAALNELLKTEDDIAVLDEPVAGIDSYFLFTRSDKGKKLVAQMDEFLTGLEESGELEKIRAAWTDDDDSLKVIEDYSSLPAENGTLGFVTEGTHPPYDYYREDELVGYEVDLAVRFCKEYGYGIEMAAMDFSGMLPAIQSGKYDFGASGTQKTEEREKTMYFSVSDFTEKVQIAVLADQTAAQTSQTETDEEEPFEYEDLEGKRIGAQTGTMFDQYLEDFFDDVDVVYYDQTSDLVTALLSDKIDAFTADEPVARYIAAENDQIDYRKDCYTYDEYGYMLNKDSGAEIQKQLNEYIAKYRGDGSLDAMTDDWFEPDGDHVIKDYKNLPDTNGTIHMAVDATHIPFEYEENGRITGLEVAFIADFCAEYGYRLDVSNMQFAAVLSGVQSGKYDLGASCITITPERAETALFSDPFYYGGAAIAVKVDAASSDSSFIPRMAESFKKTFIEESRYRLFLRGILTTMLITILSALFGTILGFLIFMACRRGNPIANKAAGFFSWLVTGMPMVVLLMILYYVVFGSVSISGTAVAVIGFTMTFGAAVLGMFKSGAAAIDIGQTEAAYALGFTDRRTFTKVILPQIMPHFIPLYKSEIVSLIKATAIVGYVAVEDLTKIGDIVRSRTFEAFFPLISVAVIYFALSAVLIAVIDIAAKHFDPTQRKKEEILKGVKASD